MAIAPVQLQRPVDTGIGALLQRGTTSLSSILQNAIQLGRDNANNQLQQERDFLGERARVEQMRERRAENILAQANRDAQFAENVFRDRRDFSTGEERYLAQQDRQSSLDQLQRDRYANVDRRAEENLALQRQQADRADQSFDLTRRVQEANIENTLLDREQRLLDRSTRESAATAVNQSIALAEDQNLSPEDQETARRSARQTYREQLLLNPEMTEGQKRALESQLGLSGSAGTTVAEQSFNYRRERDASRDANTTLNNRLKGYVANAGAFPTEDNPSSPKALNDRVEYERGVALSYDSKEAFVQAGQRTKLEEVDGQMVRIPVEMTAAERKARAEFYDLVKRGPAVSNAPAGPDDPIGDFLNRYRR